MCLEEINKQFSLFKKKTWARYFALKLQWLTAQVCHSTWTISCMIVYTFIQLSQQKSVTLNNLLAKLRNMESNFHQSINASNMSSFPDLYFDSCCFYTMLMNTKAWNSSTNTIYSTDAPCTSAIGYSFIWEISLVASTARQEEMKRKYHGAPLGPAVLPKGCGNWWNLESKSWKSGRYISYIVWRGGRW